MTKKPASVFERIARLLYACDRARMLQRHVDLAHQFALVAPLGGGAMVALHALHLPEIDDGSLIWEQPRRGRSPSQCRGYGCLRQGEICAPLFPS
jgi:hypothetical protein